MSLAQASTSSSGCSNSSLVAEGDFRNDGRGFRVGLSPVNRHTMLRKAVIFDGIEGSYMKLERGESRWSADVWGSQKDEGKRNLRSSRTTGLRNVITRQTSEKGSCLPWLGLTNEEGYGASRSDEIGTVGRS